jgi:hypothetical protein
VKLHRYIEKATVYYTNLDDLNEKLRGEDTQNHALNV